MPNKRTVMHLRTSSGASPCKWYEFASELMWGHWHIGIRIVMCHIGRTVWL